MRIHAEPGIHLHPDIDPHDQGTWMYMLSLALDSATNGIVISANRPGRAIVYCNPAFERLTGYTKEEIVGRNCRFLQGEDTDPDAPARMREAFDAGEGIELVLLNYKKDGTTFWNALNVGPLHNPSDGSVSHFIGIQTDVTERVVVQRQLEERVFTDFLTGLLNRPRFIRDLSHEANSAAMQGRFAVGFIDLDGFKSVNDTLGHDAGDALLKQVARRLQNVVRNNDLVARLAGDEFVLLLRGVETHDALGIVARRVHDTFQMPFDLAGVPTTIHASMGFVLHHTDESAPALLARADNAMYRAKRGGKNNYSID